MNHRYEWAERRGRKWEEEGVKGGRADGWTNERTNERAEPLNIHARRWIERIPLNIQPSMAMIKIIPRHGGIVFRSRCGTFSIPQRFLDKLTGPGSWTLFRNVRKVNQRRFKADTLLLHLHVLSFSRSVTIIAIRKSKYIQIVVAFVEVSIFKLCYRRVCLGILSEI